MLRFSLWSLLVLALIVAALSAWLGQHIMRASTQRPIVAKIIASGGTVGYHYQIQPEFNIVAKLVRSVLGDDIYATVDLVFLNLRNLSQLRVLETGMTDRTLDTIERFKSLRCLQLTNHPLTDDGLRNLSRLTELERLELAYTKLADDGLRALSSVMQLRYLDVSGTLVTDDGIGHLATLQNLEYIDLGNTSITDVGLLRLAELRALKHVEVGIHSGITMQGVDALKAARPSCVIDCWEFGPDGGGHHVATK